MVALSFYNFSHLPALSYRLSEVQLQFTATVENALKRIENRELKGDFTAKAVTILKDNLPAGFFVLDFGNDKFELTDNPKSVLLRSLSLNPDFQGKGIGKAAMLMIPDFVEKYFPKTEEIVLAVNDGNDAAYQLYQKCGYRYEGKTRMGRSGIQKLMKLKLQNQKFL